MEYDCESSRNEFCNLGYWRTTSLAECRSQYPFIFTAARVLYTVNPKPQTQFWIDPISERLEKHLDGMNGRCWHQLFLKPVIVEGFPIERQSQLHGGIEIPLRLMAALLGTGQTDEFNGKTFLKGFSKMAVPVEKDGETVYWHMYSSADGERISYLHATVAHASDVSVADMEECRHVLGWTSNADFHAGKRIDHHISRVLPFHRPLANHKRCRLAICKLQHSKLLPRQSKPRLRLFWPFSLSGFSNQWRSLLCHLSQGCRSVACHRTHRACEEDEVDR